MTRFRRTPTTQNLSTQSGQRFQDRFPLILPVILEPLSFKPVTVTANDLTTIPMNSDLERVGKNGMGKSLPRIDPAYVNIKGRSFSIHLMDVYQFCFFHIPPFLSSTSSVTTLLKILVVRMQQTQKRLPHFLFSPALLSYYSTRWTNHHDPHPASSWGIAPTLH